MSVALFDHLPLLASAPDGIQKFRDLILTLGVHGKLVPQDPNDEPASELLKRIAQEKARLGAKATGNKSKPTPAIGSDEKRYEIPSTWAWIRFQDVFSLEYGDSLPAPKRTETGEFPVYGSNGVVGTHRERMVTSPCIVVGRKGSAGALNLCREHGCWVTDVAYYCIPPSDVNLDFAFKLFHTLGLNELGKGIKPGLNRNEAYTIPVAIPPIAEQHRIVAKIDELMTLCDRLEAEQASAESLHAKLVDSLLATLTQCVGAADTATTWQPLSEHFDTLFSTNSSVDALKQTILELAVTGKLVPRDTKEPPIEGKINDFVEFLNGYAFKSEWFTQSGIRLLRNANVSHGSCNWTDTAYVGQDLLEEFKRFELAVGDLVLSLDRPIINTGLKIARISHQDLPCLLLQRVAKISPRANLVELDYLSIWFNSPAFTQTISPGRSNGVPHISTKQVGELSFVRYSTAEQRAIVAKVNELMRLCNRLKAHLAESRDCQTRWASTMIESALEAA